MPFAFLRANSCTGRSAGELRWQSPGNLVMSEGDISRSEQFAARGVARRASPASAHEPAFTSTPLHECAYQYASSYDAYLATEPGRLTFWSRDGHGVVTYIRDGRHALVGGGLLAPDAHKEQLL